MKHGVSSPTVVFLALIIATSAVVGVISTVRTSAPVTGIVISKPGSVVVGSVSGLNLSLSLGSAVIGTGQAVSVSLAEWNTPSTENIVPSASNWPLQGLTLGPCGTLNLPIGIGIARGFYTSSNISSAQTLQLSAPGVYACPAILSQITVYDFEPHSDTAVVVGSCDPNPCFTRSVSVAQDFGGYWSAASTFSSFTPGEYTVVGGDEWGALAILHFEVIEENSTTSTSLGLSFTLSLNTTQLEAGHAISVTADISNVLPVVNNVTGASDWASPVFRDWTASSPCPYFAYILTFSGYYTQGNISSATPLQISPPGVIVFCPALVARYYLFQPLSDEASFFGGMVLPMKAEATMSGYYTSGQSYNLSLPSGGISPTPFPAGVYTVVAGDEWGQMAVAHFSVAEGSSTTSVILPANATLKVSSSLDCLASHYSLNFGVTEQSTLTGGFSAPGVTLYVATVQQAASTFQGHPASWVYSTGLVSSSSFSVVLSPGSYVVWIEGADHGCGSGIVAPLEMLTPVNITEAFTLTSQ